MLCLVRREGQRVWINEQIRVTVVEISGGRVRLGFEADKSINIRREELPALGEKKCEG